MQTNQEFNMNFSSALTELKQGYRVQRSGWNGKGMFLFIVKGDAVQRAINKRYGNPDVPELGMPVVDTIYMKTADSKVVPWLTSQTDILADDWVQC